MAKVSVAIAFGFLSVLSSFTPVNAQSQFSVLNSTQPLNWGSLDVGTVVQQGTLVQSGTNSSCNFSPMTVETPASTGVQRGLELRANSSCQLVVYSKSELATNTPTPTYANPSVAIVNDVWMCGYGCIVGGNRADVLTEIVGTLIFTWNGYSVTAESATQTCSSHLITFWHVLACLRTAYNGYATGGNEVYLKSEGLYYWAPPPLFNPSYQHVLNAEEHAKTNGNSYCVWGWSGNIVYPGGVFETCTAYYV